MEIFINTSDSIQLRETMSKKVKVEKVKSLPEYLDAAVLCLEKIADSLDKLVYLWSASAEAVKSKTEEKKGK
jgi:hypothetical protein